MAKIHLIIVVSFFLCNTLAIYANDKMIISENKSTQIISQSMLSKIVPEIKQRSSASSQVLNLNLSNLLLLLVLKAIVYGAKYIGNHPLKGRENIEDDILSEGEAALALGYLIGDTCLYRAACEVPQIAKEYLNAAEMIFQTIKLIPRSIPIISNLYEKTLVGFQKAIDLGLKNQCPLDYSCKEESINRFLRL